MRKLLILIMILFVGVLVKADEKLVLKEGINKKVLEYRILEKKSNKTYDEKIKFVILKNEIKKFDEENVGIGRMSTYEEIDKEIKSLIKQSVNIKNIKTDNIEKPKLATAKNTQTKNTKSLASARDTEFYQPTNQSIRQVYGDVSHYGYSLHGSKTATGGRFNEWGMTAAHKTLPFGTRVRVTNKSNGKSVIVRINDRGPYIKGRVIDLSRGAFLKIAPQKQGIIKASNVLIEVLSIGNNKRKENR